jgi:hypothetical protein
MDSLIPYFAADIFLLVVIILVMAKRLTFWHPVTAYLFFHIYAFTTRCLALITGSLAMYADQPSTREVVTADELARALLWSDVALVMFCLGAAIAHSQPYKHQFRPIERRPFSKKVVLAVTTVCLPLGLIAFTSSRSGFEVADWIAGSSYYSTMGMWPIACLWCLVFLFGFRWYLLVPIVSYLIIVGLQGYHRVMLVLPLIFFTAYYLQANRRKWPGIILLTAGLVLIMVFPSLKIVGQAYKSGDLTQMGQILAESFVRPVDKKADGSGEMFLDQYAAGLTMVDEAGIRYRGSIYVAVLTLPVPRVLWANKPGLADHLIEVSTARRPYGEEGRIITYIGEAYFNFGYAGLFFVPLIAGYGLTFWCVAATAGPLRRFNRFLYTVFCIAFIQVYRDGLSSLVLFTVIHHLPIMFIWIIHYLPGVVKNVQDPPAGHPKDLDERYFRNS